MRTMMADEELMKVGIDYHQITLSKIDVYDGDTCKCYDEKGKEYLVRLVYVDAPEIEQTYGKQAKEALKKILKEIQVSELWLIVDDGIDRKDNHDRYLGYLVGETSNSANYMMLADGHAWFYNDTSRKQDPLRPDPKVTEFAQKNKIGLFADENAIEPKDWRRYSFLRFDEDVTPDKIQKIIKGVNPGWQIVFQAKKSGESNIVKEEMVESNQSGRKRMVLKSRKGKK